MSETREVADTMRAEWDEHEKSLPPGAVPSAYCREFVISKMPDESETVLSAVVWNLLTHSWPAGPHRANL